MKPAAMAAPVAGAVKQSGDVPSSVLLNPDLKSFLPFVSKGHVSLVGSHYKVPVMFRYTAAFDSFIVGSTLPFSDETDTGSFVPVRDMGMSVFRVPLHKLVLHSDLLSGVVKMGVRPALPVEKGSRSFWGMMFLGVASGLISQPIRWLSRYCLALVGRMKMKNIFLRCLRHAL